MSSFNRSFEANARCKRGPSESEFPLGGPRAWAAMCPSPHGEVPEWLNGLVSKTSVSFGAPGVQIPPSPPSLGAIPWVLLPSSVPGFSIPGPIEGIRGWGRCFDQVHRRGDGAAERARLESVCVGNGTGGSNPPLSAIHVNLPSPAMGPVPREISLRTGSGRERSSPKDQEVGARCPGLSAGSVHSLAAPGPLGTSVLRRVGHANL